MKTKRLFPVAVILAMLMLLCACGKDGGIDNTGANYDADAQACAKGKNPAEVLVMTVGEQEVYLDEVNFFAISFLRNVDLSQIGGIDDPYNAQYPKVDDALKAQVLMQIRQTKILYAHAMEIGITLDEKEQKDSTANAEKFIGANDMERLGRYGITDELVKRLYDQYAIITKMEEQIKSEAEKSDETFGCYDNLVFVKLELDENGAPVVDDEGKYKFLSEAKQTELKEKAEEALERAKAGEELTDLAKEYGVENTSGTNYDLTENIKKNYGLKDGEVSGLIENEYGYLIVKVVKNEDAEYTKSANEYSDKTAEEEAVQTQEQELFDNFEISDDDMKNGVWEKFTFSELSEFAN